MSHLQTGCSQNGFAQSWPPQSPHQLNHSAGLAMAPLHVLSISLGVLDIPRLPLNVLLFRSTYQMRDPIPLSMFFSIIPTSSYTSPKLDLHLDNPMSPQPSFQRLQHGGTDSSPRPATFGQRSQSSSLQLGSRV